MLVVVDHRYRSSIGSLLLMPEHTKKLWNRKVVVSRMHLFSWLSTSYTQVKAVIYIFVYIFHILKKILLVGMLLDYYCCDWLLIIVFILYAHQFFYLNKEDYNASRVLNFFLWHYHMPCSMPSDPLWIRLTNNPMSNDTSVLNI